jgi:hypothetical protein
MPDVELDGAPAPRRRHLDGLAPVAAALALVAVIVGVAVARPGSSEHSLPDLSLVQVAGGGLGVAEGGPALGAPSGRFTGWGEWRLEGDLPDGPSSAAVHRLGAGPVERSLVEHLATALGLDATPQHLDGGWYVLDGTRELSVSERAGRHWVYADHGCVAGPVLDPQEGVGCAIAQPGGVVTAEPAPPDPGSDSPPPVSSPVPSPPVPSPVPSPQPVSADDAARAARPVLAAVGLDPATARVQSSGDQRDVVVRPRVDDLTVVGLDTRVTVGPDAESTDAAGWLSTPTPGPDYPVITAQAAFERLRDQPRPLMAEMPCEVPVGAADCPAPPDRIVRGAHLGLALGYESGGALLLVPAWLFDVRGQEDPAVVVAVEPDYLGQPDATTGGSAPGSTGGSAPGSTGGSAPGSTGGSTGSVAPATGGPAPAEPRP